MVDLILRDPAPNRILLTSGGPVDRPTVVAGSNGVTGTTTNPSSLSVTIPAGVVAGDVALLFIHWAQAGTMGDPTSITAVSSGAWVQRYHQDGSDYQSELWIYSAPVDATDAGDTITVTLPSGSAWSVSVVAVRGAISDGSDPFDTIPTRITEGGTSKTFPSVTPSDSRNLILAWQAALAPQDAGSGFPVPSGFTEAVDTGGTDEFRNQAVSYRDDYDSVSPITPGGVTHTDSGTSAQLTLSMPAGGPADLGVDLYDGSSWVLGVVEIWDGSSWIPASIEPVP